MKIGLVGLGRMGAAMSTRLAERGLAVVAWDHDAQKVKALRAGGLKTVASAHEVAAEADIIITIISEDHGIRQVFTGADGLLQADVAGKLFIEMTTLQPMTTRELAPQVEARGARIIDAPVLGSIPTVLEGKLFALVGGRAEDVDRGRPVLDHLTRRIAHMGPIGSGHAMKLAVNLGLASYIQALAESLALGTQEGLDLHAMLDVLQEAPYASGWLKAKIAVLEGAKPDVTLDIRTLRKDVMSAIATGALSGVPMPLSAGALASLSAAVAAGFGDGDLGELPKFVRSGMVQSYDTVGKK